MNPKPPQARPPKPEQPHLHDSRPKPHDVKKRPRPPEPADATGINPGDRHPIDPRSPYLPPQ